MTDTERLDWLESRRADLIAPGQWEKHDPRDPANWTVRTDLVASQRKLLRDSIDHAEELERAEKDREARKAEVLAKLTEEERGLFGL